MTETQKNIELGVFIPVGNNGWIHSINTPDTPGTYEHVRKVTLLAESLGYDFVLSPSIWRGLQGPSQHWSSVSESITTSAGLLEATSRIKVLTTAHMTIFPPAVIAKMVATLDQIGPGRIGLNLVTGGSYLDLAHVGLWNDDLDHDDKYDLGDEWVSLVKQFWTDEVVDHHGRFFNTINGTMGPKPTVMPTLVNAGASPRGLKFAAQNCDIAFITASDDAASLETARMAKQIAATEGKNELRTYGVVTIVPGETDEEAQKKMDHLNAGIDLVAKADILAGYQQNRSYEKLSAGSIALAGGEKMSATLPGEIVGSYESIAKRLATIVHEGNLDGFMLVVPDFIDDLDAVSKRTMPLLEEYGISCNVRAQ